MRPTWVPGGYFFIHIVACERGGELKFCTLYIFLFFIFKKFILYLFYLFIYLFFYIRVCFILAKFCQVVKF
jgi:hypothetical protein